MPERRPRIGNTIQALNIGAEHYAVSAMITLMTWLFMRQVPPLKRAVTSICAGYMFLLLAGTLFLRQTSAMHRYQTELFWTYRRISRGGEMAEFLKEEILVNILMTVPIGFTAAMAAKKWRLAAAFTAGGAVSVFIEIMQLVLKRGLFEFDDMVHNVTGAVIGWFLFRTACFVHRIFLQNDRRR